MFGIGKKKEETKVIATEQVTIDVEENDIDIVEKDTGVAKYDETTIDPSKTIDMPESAVINGQVNDESEPAPLTIKEANALKYSRYEEKIAHNNKFKKAFVIRNKKTNQVVELRAASSFHACKIIGWRPRKVQVLSVRDIENTSDVPETVGRSS